MRPTTSGYCRRRGGWPTQRTVSTQRPGQQRVVAATDAWIAIDTPDYDGTSNGDPLPVPPPAMFTVNLTNTP